MIASIIRVRGAELIRLFAFIAILFSVILKICTPYKANAALELTISKEGNSKVGFSVVKFSSSSSQSLAQNIEEIIISDLESTNLFSHIPENNFPEKVLFPQSPTLLLWKNISSTIVVTGRVEFDGSIVRLSCNIFDSCQKKLAISYSASVSANSTRWIAHEVSNRIYKYITGNSGYFNSKIASVSTETKFDTIIVSDYDGENARSIFASREDIQSPVLCNGGKALIFIERYPTFSKILMLDIEKNKIFELLRVKGQGSSLSITRDGSKIAFLIDEEDIKLVIYNLISKSFSVVTKTKKFIMSAATISPDGTQVVFSSNHEGRNSIYLSSINGDNIRNITPYTSGGCFDPVFSHKGDIVAFSHKINGVFALNILNISTGEYKVIKEYKLSQQHSFSYDDSSIVLSSSNSKYRRYIERITIYGGKSSFLRGNAVYPNWGQ